MRRQAILLANSALPISHYTFAIIGEVNSAVLLSVNG
jgi:hypothetical protein